MVSYYIIRSLNYTRSCAYLYSICITILKSSVFQVMVNSEADKLGLREGDQVNETKSYLLYDIEILLLFIDHFTSANLMSMLTFFLTLFDM